MVRPLTASGPGSDTTDCNVIRSDLPQRYDARKLPEAIRDHEKEDVSILGFLQRHEYIDTQGRE